MDIQYFGGNCVMLTGKKTRIVIDDNLAELGLKSVSREGDVVLFTGLHKRPDVDTRLLIDGPGEYEVQDLSIIGIPVRGHMDDAGTSGMTIYKVSADETTFLFMGHIYPQLNDQQIEMIGTVDVMCVPVGGNGYTLDAIGALQLIKAVEPKLVIPTHYADPAVRYPVEQQTLEHVLKDLGMEVRETTAKLRIKPGEILSTTQLEVLTRS